MSTTDITPTVTFAEVFTRIASNMERVIRGKDDVVEMLLLCLLAEGHLLIEDVPGVGKTTLAKALASSVDTTFGRVQFTPDLLPSDVLGITVWDRENSRFDFRPGPVFGGIVLADEINRASPKTQSALLECMAENQVTVDGSTYRLSMPFMVLATQNSIEHEGTFPLPDSQLDRFLMRVSVGYPDRSSEIDILDTHGESDQLSQLRPVVTKGEIQAMIEATRSGPTSRRPARVPGRPRRCDEAPSGRGARDVAPGDARTPTCRQGPRLGGRPDLRAARRHQGAGPRCARTPTDAVTGSAAPGPRRDVDRQPDPAAGRHTGRPGLKCSPAAV